MDEQNTNSKVNAAVADIHKDFVVVGKHRVHSWYAWAIVGIVFGMALGIVYVANRSGQVTPSDAAQKVQRNFTLNGNADYIIPVIVKKNAPTAALGSEIIAYSPVFATNLLNVQSLRPTRTATGQYISNIVSSANSTIGILALDGTKLYRSTTNSNGMFTVNTQAGSSDLVNDLAKTATFKFRGVLVEPGVNGGPNKRTQIPVMVGSLYCGFPLPENLNLGCVDSNRTFTLDANSTIQVPAGMSVYAEEISFNIPKSSGTSITKKLVNRFVLPAGFAGAINEFKFVIEKNGNGRLQLKRIVNGTDEVSSPEVQFDVLPNDGEVVPLQCAQYEKTSLSTFDACLQNPSAFPVLETAPKGTVPAETR